MLSLWKGNKYKSGKNSNLKESHSNKTSKNWRHVLIKNGTVEFARLEGLKQLQRALVCSRARAVERAIDAHIMHFDP